MLSFNLFVAGLILLNVIIVATYHRFTILKSINLDRQKFQLYALRDEFVGLVIGESLQPTERVMEAYDFINRSIMAVEKMKFDHFVENVLKNYKQVRAVPVAYRDERVWGFEVRALWLLIVMVLSKSWFYRSVVHLSTKDGLMFLVNLKQVLRQRDLLKEERALSQAYKWAMTQGAVAVVA